MSSRLNSAQRPRNAQENWDLRDSLTPFSFSLMLSYFSQFTEKISRHFQEKALPPYRFQPQAVIRDVSSGSDLGIPPNRGPLPVRTNPNSEPNTRVRSGHRRNARPQGIRGARAHRGAM